MGAAYKILGMNVKPHVLAIATIGATIGGAAFAMSGSKTENEAQKPVKKEAASKGEDLDVEKLLDQFLKEETK
ncbi:LAFE_0F13168g1_1 [Lachancea fermentati]|uniref:LAFE_0F13168g1_1 n=1 Tax=Lachancea fermentati TaxID=4955 RepID=A0A1G4MG61_LACFM|nr:LAFE_0F13168g1_1 [Lachancea fermentati]